MVVRLVVGKREGPPSETLSLGLQAGSQVPNQDTVGVTPLLLVSQV